MTVSQRGTTGATGPVLVSATPSASMSVTGSWGSSQTRSALDLLVAVVSIYGSSTVASYSCSTSGWSLQSYETATGIVTAIYVKIAAGSDTAPTFVATTTGTAADSALTCTLYDLYDSSGETPSVYAIAASTQTTSTSYAFGTGANILLSGCFAVVATTIGQGTTAAATTWTTPTSWAIGTNTTASARSQTANFFYSPPETGASLSVDLAHSRATTFESACMLVVCPPATVKASTLNDPLTSYNTTLWGVTAAGVTFSAAGLAMATTTASYYANASANNYYDLTGSYVLVKLSAGSQTLTSPLDNQLQVYDNMSNTLAFQVYAGNLIAFYNMQAGGGAVDVVTSAYNPAVHAWLRIRESAGTIYWDYAPDGINWVNFASIADPFPVSSVSPGLYTATYGTNTLTTTVTWFDFDVSPPAWIPPTWVRGRSVLRPGRSSGIKGVYTAPPVVPKFSLPHAPSKGVPLRRRGASQGVQGVYSLAPYKAPPTFPKGSHGRPRTSQGHSGGHAGAPYVLYAKPTFPGGVRGRPQLRYPARGRSSGLGGKWSLVNPPPVIVQSVSFAGLTGSFPNPVTAGNTIVVSISGEASASPTVTGVTIGGIGDNFAAAETAVSPEYSTGGGGSGHDEYNTNSTWICPAGVTTVSVYITENGSGGNSWTGVPVTPGNSYAVTPQNDPVQFGPSSTYSWFPANQVDVYWTNPPAVNAWQFASCWIDPGCTGGSQAVAVAANLATSEVTIYEVAYLAANPLDQGTGEGSTGTAWGSNATAETTTAKEIWFGCSSNYGTGLTWPASPWIVDFQGSANSAGHQVVAAEGTASYGGTQATSLIWAAVVITLKGGTYVPPLTGPALIVSIAAAPGVDDYGNPFPVAVSAQQIMVQAVTAVPATPVTGVIFYYRSGALWALGPSGTPVKIATT